MKSAIRTWPQFPASCILQRALYIRNTYKFRLSWEYCLLDPMDLVTVADSILGLSNAAIRITEIEEDENGFLQRHRGGIPAGRCDAQCFIRRSRSATIRSTATSPPIRSTRRSSSSRRPRWSARRRRSGSRHPAAPAASPIRTGAAAMSGCRRTAPRIPRSAQSTGRRAQGVLTASLPSYGGTNPDTTDTLAVNMAESGQALASGSAACRGARQSRYASSIPS